MSRHKDNVDDGPDALSPIIFMSEDDYLLATMDPRITRIFHVMLNGKAADQ